MLLEKVWLLSEIEMLVSKQERIVAKVAVFLFFTRSPYECKCKMNLRNVEFLQRNC